MLLAVGVAVTYSPDALGGAQAGRGRSAALVWTVQVDPLTMALGFVHVQIERRVAGRLSLYAGPHIRAFNGIRSAEDDNYTGVGAELGVRWFFRGGAPSGSWLLVRGVVALVTSGDDRQAGGYASVLAGHTWIFDRRWVLSLGLGVQYLHYAVGEQGTEGWLPAAHTAIGFAF